MEFSLENEDIHMNIETILTQRIGDTGKRLHTARSRNDQVAVDFRMYVRKEIQAIIGLILDLEKVLVKKAEANLDTVMPGYTHLQRAQPTTFAHAMMAYANMFTPGRDKAGGLPGADGRVPPGGRGPGYLHLSRSTGSRPHRLWASPSPPTTRWTRCPIGISPWSSSRPAPF